MSNDSLYDDAIVYFTKADNIYGTLESTDRKLFSDLLYKMAYAYSLKRDEKNFDRTIIRLFLELERQKRFHGKERAEGFLLIGDLHERKDQQDSALVAYQLASRSPGV